MASYLSDFYRGKRVLVTGHTGFQGGWLVAWLKLLGAQICGYGLPPASRPNFFDATILDRGITSIFSDIRDRNALANAFAEFQPEIVVHCAAQTNLESAQRDSVQTFSTNVMGTVHVLEESRQTESVRALVIASRVDAYEDRGWFWGHRGEDALGASEPISSSFACSELAASAYIESFFKETKTAIATARTANLIGGGDWADGRLIPDLVRAITSNQQIVLRQHSAVPWQHALEAARAYLLLSKKLYEDGEKYSGAWNFTPAETDAIDSQQLATAFAKHFGNIQLQSQSERDSSGAKPAPHLNTNKSKAQLGWKPALQLEEAITWSAEWYRDYYSDPASAWRVTEDQIGRYMRLK